MAPNIIRPINRGVFGFDFGSPPARLRGAYQIGPSEGIQGQPLAS
jgi:hypothetical protein